MPASTPNLAAAQRIAERFAALTDAQRRAAYAKMQAEGLQMAQFPVPRRQAGTDGAAACALSHAQERQWFLWQLEPQGSAYHMAETLRLQGPLDEAALRAAFHALVARHAALRTVFRPGEDGLPQQLVQPAQALDIQLWAHDGDTPDSDAVQARLHTLVHTPFDLAQGPLLRVALVRLGAQDHVLAVVMHHIVSDGRSLQILVAEFAELYQSGCAGQAAALKPLPVTYADYALWQRQWLAAGEKERQLAYWRAQLGDEHPVLQLPTDHPRRADGRYTAAQHELDLPQALVQGLRRQAQQQGGTLFMALLAGLQALLYRHTGEADMRVGVPIANRHRSETEGVVGFFVNTQVLRSQLHDGLPLQALLAQAIEASLGAQDHQDLPFEQLVEALQPERSLGSSPLFQVLLNHQRQSATASAQAIAGLQVQSLAPAAPAALFELMLDVAEDEAGQPRLKFVYARELFEPASIARMAGHYLALLQALVDAPAQALGRVPLLGAAEQAQLRQWRQPLLQDAPVAPLHELIEAQAQRQPAAIALTLGDAHVSYAELNQRANRVAHQLIARGVGPECKVGLAVERSIELVVGLLAILKAGGAYVPLDPDYPAERLAYMVEDSGLALLLSTSALRDKVPVPATLPVLCLDAPSPLLADAHAHNPARAAHVDQLAYVIYTSGSTGRPKGAQLSHRHVARLLSATAPWFGFGPQDVWTLFHSYAFDFSVWEIFGALCTGGRLVVVPYWVSRSPADFMALLRSEQVTVLNQTPSAFQQLVHLPEEEGAAPLALRQVIFGGEALEPESLRPWFDRHGDETPRLVNMYGITETTVHVTYRPITRADLADLAGGRSPVGRAIPDLGLQVLDAALNPLPVGVPGELHVSGAGLARGYLGRPGLSAERFIADPFGPPGARLYRTGDLVRWRADGQLDYLGRIDQQVKIRGFRIELGEIETQLLAQPEVQAAVVLVRSAAGGDRLVGYVVPQPGAAADAALLRERLAAQLPEYMVPAALVLLPALPLNANGKVDRKALPEPELATAQQAFEPPQGEVEQALATLWVEVLGLPQVGRADNFFALGGHSLLAIQLLERMRRQGWKVQVRELFQHPRLADFAKLVEPVSVDELAAPAPQVVGIPPGCESITPAMLPLVALQDSHLRLIESQVPGGAANIQDVYPLAPLQEGILFHHMMQAEGDVYVNAFLLGFDSRERLQAFVEALNQVVARHDILRTAVLWDGLPEPVQVVARRAELAIEWPLEGAATAGDEVAAQLTALVQARDFRIDVRRAPMMRLLAAQDAANQRWLLQLPSHHLALDHASEELLVEEIAQILQGRASQLPAPVPFRRFVAQAREAADPAEQTRFFKAMLADVTEPTAPFDLLDLQGDGASLAEARQMLAPALAQALRQQCRLAGIGAATLFHLAWALVLGKTTARDDVVFGTVLFGRMQGGEGAERALGLFINTLPLRVKLRGLGVAAALRQTHAALTELLHHEHASLSLAQRCSGVPAGTPLCATLLNYRHVTPAQADAAQEARTWQGIETLAFHESSNYPFGLSVNDQGEGFELIAQIDRRVSAQRICDDMQRAVQQLVQALATQPDQPLHTLALLSPLEQAQLQTWGRGDASGCDGRLVHQLVAEQAALRPDAVALIMGEQQLSYAELDTRANRLAHRLIAAGVAPEVRVGLALPRSLDMVVALLAVLKAGGAYVPLDANYPAERLAYMLADSGVALLLAHTRTQRGLPAPATLLLDTLDLADQPTHAPEVPLHGEHLAYVIYTSGSTGQPKGVAVAHGPLAMHVQTIGLAYGMRPEDRELQFASISFDGAHERIWVPLAFGSALMPRDEELWSVERTCEEIQRHGITVACFTPSYLHQMAELMGEAASRLPIRSYTVGGEAMPRTSLALVHAVLKPERVINGYGPTETVITPTIAKAERGENFDAAYMPIGRLVGDRTAHVLDAALRPLPPGVAGELYLGGSGLARGYLGRAGLSAERFVADPFSENGARLYRTGDLVRWRSNAAPRTGLPPGPPPKGDQELGSGPSFLDGQLEYLGRIDHQVKIRGFRIELGEVEAQLLAQPEVREAVAVALPGGAGLRLVAYVSLLPGQPVDGATLRSRLAELLPEHMLPSLTVVLPTLPLNLNGKVDRAALPAPAFEAAAEHAAPQGAAETTLATLWAEVLGVPRVGRHDNFFELGGDSILSLQIVARARERGWRLTPRQLFERQTVAQLAQVAEPVHAAGPAAVAALPGGWLPLLPIQADFFAQAAPSLHWNQAVLLQSRSALQPEPLRAALAALLRQHPSLRLRFGRSAEGVWQQRYAAADEADAAELLWLRQAADAAELQRHCDEAQRSISVQHGPLLRALAVQLPDASWRLLLAIHHLAVDGVSWRILLQDLETALRQQAAGQPVVLAPATSRYDEWVQALQARAADHGHELPHWLAQAEAAEPWSWGRGRPRGRKKADLGNKPSGPAPGRRAETAWPTRPACRSRCLPPPRRPC